MAIYDSKFSPNHPPVKIVFEELTDGGSYPSYHGDMPPGEVEAAMAAELPEASRMNWHLGEPVRVTHILKRVTPPKEHSKRVWIALPMNNLQGIVTGKRTLSNGKTVYDDGYSANLYIPKESFRAYHVVFDIHCKHVITRPEYMEEL